MSNPPRGAQASSETVASDSRPEFPDEVSTLSVHAGESRQKPGDSITDPIFCASTFTFADSQSVIDYIEQKQPREEYGRYGNPGERVVERKLARWRAARTACCFPAAWRPSWVF